MDIHTRIAGRVKALRTDKGMTLAALATRCGVSRSMLSLIERGDSNPTAVVLEKIATGLGVSLATLFEDAAVSAVPISRKTDRTSWRDPQSGYVRRNISPPQVPSPIHIVEVVLPAGATVMYETASRPMQIHQQIWVQTGCLDVTLGSDTYSLAEDDCFAMQLQAPVSYCNPTQAVTRYIVVVAEAMP